MNRHDRFATIALAVALVAVLVSSAWLLAEDCNMNGTEDQCDLSCGPTGGACDLPGCGSSQDCNANGVPDECDTVAPRRQDARDWCADAQPVGPGRVYFSAGVPFLWVTNDGMASCGLPGPSLDVWYRYTPAANGSVTISLCGSTFDTVLSVHTACPGTSANEAACNDDFCDFQSEVTTSVSAGQTYFIRIARNGGAAGDNDYFFMVLAGPACLDCADDCNGNGVPDECDVRDHTSQDCNGNYLPDECESQADCNSNGVQDICDITSGTSTDCNHNAILDECDSLPDCNGNGIWDDCENGVLFLAESAQLSPIGWEVPQSYTILSPPRAGSDVLITIWARGDLDMVTPPCKSEWLELYVN